MVKVVDYSEFIRGIFFRLIQPHTPMTRRLAKFLNHLTRLGFPLERLIVKLPDGDKHMKLSLHKICRIPKMSTFTLGALINRGVSQMPDSEAFVNIGVWHGFTFLCGMINNSERRQIRKTSWVRMVIQTIKMLLSCRKRGCC